MVMWCDVCVCEWLKDSLSEKKNNLNKWKNKNKCDCSVKAVCKGIYKKKYNTKQ